MFVLAFYNKGMVVWRLRIGFRSRKDLLQLVQQMHKLNDEDKQLASIAVTGLRLSKPYIKRKHRRNNHELSDML
jgi:hypothetical protein